MSAFSMISFNSWFFLILQSPFSSCTGPKISLNIIFYLHSVIFEILTGIPR
jgi:hypothetical protein